MRNQPLLYLPREATYVPRSVYDDSFLVILLPTPTAESQRRGRALLQTEVPAAAQGRQPDAAAEPGEHAEGDAEHAAGTEVGVVTEGDADVEEDLFDEADGQLGLDLGRVGRDLGECLEDGGA